MGVISGPFILTLSYSVMKRIFFLLLCLHFFPMNSQDIDTELKATYSLEAEKFVGVDEFKNIYYINDNILFKKTSKKLFSYSNIELGKLSMVNIQNPFKVILFYANFNTAIILDNNLNELTQKIDFTNETLVNNVLFVTAASQNNLWLYANDNKLHLYDYQLGKEILQTQPITFYNRSFLPENIVSTYKNIWILAKNGVLEFNEYGIYTRGYNIKDADQVFPFQKGFIYTIDDSFFYNDLTKFIKIQLNHKVETVATYVNSSTIFLYDGAKVHEYQIKR